MAIGGLVAIGIPFSGILLAYFNGGYSEPGEWIYVFITPWHLITLVGLYFLVMAYVIKEKGKRK